MDPVRICNIALGHIGQLPIASLDGTGTAEQLCAALYPALRDVVLEAKDWTWATGRFNLDPVLPAPAWGYSTAFEIPEGALLLREVRDSAGRVEFYAREGRRVLCDSAGPLYVRCIMRVEDADLFSPGFVYALSLLLAAELTGPLTENLQRAEEFRRGYDRALVTAGANDGMQTTPVQKRTVSRLARARY